MTNVREQVENYGADSVATLSIISEISGVSVDKLNEIVNEMGNVSSALIKANNKKWKISKKQAQTLNLLGELTKRNLKYSSDRKVRITSPEVVIDLYGKELSSYDVEHVFVLNLNNKNEVIQKKLIGLGGARSAIVDISAVLREALLLNATSIMLLHNHPSGDPTPSRDDVIITKKLVEASKTVDITTLDHIIIGKNGQYQSLKERNQMED